MLCRSSTAKQKLTQLPCNRVKMKIALSGRSEAQQGSRIASFFQKNSFSIFLFSAFLLWAESGQAAINSRGGTPVAPSGLAASPVSTSQINLSWLDNSSSETGFKVERAPESSTSPGNPGTFVQIATVGAGVRTYSSTGLAQGTRYFYRVRAYNAKGNSAYSNTANAYTMAALICDQTLSPASSSVAATSSSGSVSVTSSSSTCSWTAVSNSSWITVTSGGSGTGNGTVTYSVSANTTSGTRTGTISIGTDFFTVNQSKDTTLPSVPT